MKYPVVSSRSAVVVNHVSFSKPRILQKEWMTSTCASMDCFIHRLKYYGHLQQNMKWSTLLMLTKEGLPTYKCDRKSDLPNSSDLMLVKNISRVKLETVLSNQRSRMRGADST